MKPFSNAEVEFFIAHYDTRFSERDNQKKLAALGLSKSKTTIHSWKTRFILGVVDEQKVLSRRSERIKNIEDKIAKLTAQLKELKECPVI